MAKLMRTCAMRSDLLSLRPLHITDTLAAMMKKKTRRMNWEEFANKISGEYSDNSNGFIGGDIILKFIKKERKGEQIRIQKRIRRSYEASSHYNVEKFEIEYFIKSRDFGKTRLTRKNIFGRIGKEIQNKYKIEGDNPDFLIEILRLKELEYLLKYPKSEFIILKNTIKFKSQSLGQMKEELTEIFEATEMIKERIKTTASKWS